MNDIFILEVSLNQLHFCEWLYSILLASIQYLTSSQQLNLIQLYKYLIILMMILLSRFND